jgi:tetratricopeptide (TPR) repeat protein
MKRTGLFLSTLLLLLSFFNSAGFCKEDELFLKAQKYFFQKKFEMAELLLQEVIKSNPENALAYSYLGDILLKKQLYDGALNLYKKIPGPGCG